MKLGKFLSSVLIRALASKRVIVDCDPGIDDALAIKYLLNIRNEVEIVAVTIVDGNVKTQQGAANALRIFKSNDIDDIPLIYLGADFPENSDGWYGADGLGNQQEVKPIVPVEDVMNGLFSEIVMDKSAGQAIVDLTLEFDDISILSLGPLTNIAQALKLDSSLPERITEWTVMGGNLYGAGNAPDQAAEYNFWFDYKSAERVISSFLPHLTPTIVTLELARQFPFPISFWNDMEDSFIKSISKYDAQRYFSDFEPRCQFDNGPGWRIYDLLAAICHTNPEIITEVWEHKVGVETYGMFTKGMLVIDRYSHNIFDYNGKAKLPISVDMDRLISLPGMQSFQK